MQKTDRTLLSTTERYLKTLGLENAGEALDNVFSGRSERTVCATGDDMKWARKNFA